MLSHGTRSAFNPNNPNHRWINGQTLRAAIGPKGLSDLAQLVGLFKKYGGTDGEIERRLGHELRFGAANGRDLKRELGKIQFIVGQVGRMKNLIGLLGSLPKSGTLFSEDNGRLGELVRLCREMHSIDPRELPVEFVTRKGQKLLMKAAKLERQAFDEWSRSSDPKVREKLETSAHDQALLRHGFRDDARQKKLTSHVEALLLRANSFRQKARGEVRLAALFKSKTTKDPGKTRIVSRLASEYEEIRRSALMTMNVLSQEHDILRRRLDAMQRMKERAQKNPKYMARLSSQTRGMIEADGMKTGMAEVQRQIRYLENALARTKEGLRRDLARASQGWTKYIQTPGGVRAIPQIVAALPTVELFAYLEDLNAKKVCKRAGRYYFESDGRSYTKAEFRGIRDYVKSGEFRRRVDAYEKDIQTHEDETDAMARRHQPDTRISRIGHQRRYNPHTGAYENTEYRIGDRRDRELQGQDFQNPSAYRRPWVGMHVNFEGWMDRYAEETFEKSRLFMTPPEFRNPKTRARFDPNWRPTSFDWFQFGEGPNSKIESTADIPFNMRSLPVVKWQKGLGWVRQKMAGPYRWLGKIMMDVMEARSIDAIHEAMFSLDRYFVDHPDGFSFSVASRPEVREVLKMAYHRANVLADPNILQETEAGQQYEALLSPEGYEEGSPGQTAKAVKWFEHMKQNLRTDTMSAWQMTTEAWDQWESLAGMGASQARRSIGFGGLYGFRGGQTPFSLISDDRTRRQMGKERSAFMKGDIFYDARTQSHGISTPSRRGRFPEEEMGF
jgi:hypothetical protein